MPIVRSAAEKFSIFKQRAELLFAAIICPFPTMLAVSGIVWRIIIGLLGCFLPALGIYKIAGKK